MARRRCFVIIPFKPEFDDVFEEICQAAADAGLDCRRGDHHQQPGAIMEQIERDIQESDLIIADLSEENLNVYYEVGIAHSVRRPERTILLAREGRPMPFDLQSQRHLRYVANRKGYAALRVTLAEWIRKAVERFPDEDGAVVGKVPRTRFIVDSARRVAEEWATSGTSATRFVRTIAGLASLAISEHEAELDPPRTEQDVLYQRLLELERDALLDLLDQGAKVAMILRPPAKFESSRGWTRLALRLQRMILLLEGKSDSRDPERRRKDLLVRDRCRIVFSAVPESNTLILGDQIAFEVFRRGHERGFEGTYWTSRRDQLDGLIASFDAKFAKLSGEDPHTESAAIGPLDQSAAIEELRTAQRLYRESVGAAWDESMLVRCAGGPQ